ncbi:MAG: DUF1501 domain-containing protein, partial [Planctomycetota bacterium]
MSHFRRAPSGQAGFCRRTRREFLWQGGAGFGAAAIADLLQNDGVLASESISSHASKVPAMTDSRGPMAVKASHFAPKAKSVIFLFMYGGPSHIDTFDYKPEMKGMDGKTATVKTFGRGGHKAGGRIVEPRWDFAQHGQCGKWVSSLFPHLANHVDDIAFLHSMTADSPIHGSAMLMMNSGKILSGNPALGSWLTYGLGSENQNLPGFVVMLDPTGGPISGAKNWSSGYMPATYQGTVFRTEGAPILDLNPSSDLPAGVQRRLIDEIQSANQRHLTQYQGEEDLASRIASYELAYRMQTAAPEAVDLSDESQQTLDMYGVEQPKTADFGRRCLLARRLVQRGVRFVQLYSGGAHNDDNWDAHGDLEKNHNHHAGATDQPIAALLADLKRTGLLEETLVVWGGEFGRQPTAEYAKGSGRDHNA